MSQNTRPRDLEVFPMPKSVTGPFDEGNYALLVRDNSAGLQALMVHTEGVAYLVTEDKDWCWTDYDPTQKHWTLEELIDLCGKTEPVNLADWIRTFGHRLESNFYQARHWALED